MSLIKKLKKLSPMLQKREQVPKCVGATRKKKLAILISAIMELSKLDRYFFQTVARIQQ
jgi:hypothetical protein